MLNGYLSEREYKMFVTLHCAVVICSSKVYQHLLPLARHLFIDFIEDHMEIHGESSITMNIHNTSHVVDDVEKFGPLNTISAYEFENSLHGLKLRLKQCNKPLQQAARRISETATSSKSIALKSTKNLPLLNHPHTLSENMLVFRSIEFKPNTVLSSVNDNQRDKWFLTSKNVIVEFYFIEKKQGRNMIHGAALRNVESYFTSPFDSSKYLNIFSSDGEKFEPQLFEVNDIKAKMYCLPHHNPCQNKWVFMPLLHTL